MLEIDLAGMEAPCIGPGRDREEGIATKVAQTAPIRPVRGVTNRLGPMLSSTEAATTSGNGPVRFMKKTNLTSIE